MLQELQDPRVETGLTNQLIEDVPPFREHQFIIQAREFMKRGTHPFIYYEAVRESLPKVPGIEHRTALKLLETIEFALINKITDEFNAANEQRGDGDTKAVKPRELYFKYNKILRLVVKRQHMTTALHAERLLQDIYLEQTLSEGDLNNPDYVDSYTGELIVDEEIQGNVHDLVDKAVRANRHIDPRNLLKAALDYHEPDYSKTTAISQGHKETLKWALQVKQDLDWDEETTSQFIAAQMDGYDAESDDIPLQDDDVDPYTPPTLIPNDLVLDRELWYSAQEDRYAINKARSQIFARMQQESERRKAWRKRFKKMKRDTRWHRYWYQKYWELRKKPRKNTWHHIFRKRFIATDAFAQMLVRINRVAQEDVVTAATIYLSLAGDYGITENDVHNIHGLYQLPEQFYKPEQITPGAYIPLVNFANEWEDDLLNLSQDAMSPTSETNPHDYQDVLMDVITTDENGDIEVIPAPFRAVMPKYDPNPLNTAAWNIGFSRAATAKTTWPQAEAAGWANWRREMSPDAAAEYDRVYSQTKDRRKAMAAFWNACPREVPRPQDSIKNIDATKKGLNLTNGRFITWNVAKIKIEKDEIYLAKDLKARLLAKLKELNCGQAIWSLLK